MKTREDIASSDTYLYSTVCGDSPLNAALDTRLLLVGGQASSECSHLSSMPAANQNAATSAYDPTTADASKVHFLALEQVPKSSSNDRLMPDQVRNMNNSMSLTNPSDVEFSQARIRRESKRLAACTLKEFLLIILCVILITLLVIILFLYFASFKCKLIFVLLFHALHKFIPYAFSFKILLKYSYYYWSSNPLYNNYFLIKSRI